MGSGDGVAGSGVSDWNETILGLGGLRWEVCAVSGTFLGVAGAGGQVYLTGQGWGQGCLHHNLVLSEEGNEMGCGDVFIEESEGNSFEWAYVPRKWGGWKWEAIGGRVVLVGSGS